MALKYKRVVSIMFSTLLCVMCDPGIYQYRAQTMNSDNRYPPLAYRNYYPLDTYALPSEKQGIHHTRPLNYHIDEPRHIMNSSYTFSDFFNTVNELDSNPEELRTADARQGFPSYFPDLRVTSSTKHGHHKTAPTEVTHYQTYTTTEDPPAENPGINVSFLKPDWGSVSKPASNTSMDKWSGLLQLILAFLTGSKSGNLELNGFKDIIVNGLLKPILVAKGNIKSFISKITIPLLSLLLINVEVLVTVWWLWEDCPKEMKMESMSFKSANNSSYA